MNVSAGTRAGAADRREPRASSITYGRARCPFSNLLFGTIWRNAKDGYPNFGINFYALDAHGGQP